MQKPAVYRDILLRPGEWYFGDASTRMRTLLGSCVAITLWHPRQLLGGMCHYLLPTRGNGRMTTPDGRYGDEALGLLLQEVIRYQTDPHDYHIKLFGGSHMYPEYGETRMERIGADNVLQGRHLLAAFGLAIMAQHVGGTGHRILIFEVWSGDVWVRYQPHTPGVVYNQASGAVR